MKITKEIVQKTAHPARFTFDEQGKKQMIQELQKRVESVDKLEEEDTDGVEPLAGMSTGKNVFREDESGDHLSRKRVFKNAPKHDSEYFSVPKVTN